MRHIFDYVGVFDLGSWGASVLLGFLKSSVPIGCGAPAINFLILSLRGVQTFVVDPLLYV